MGDVHDEKICVNEDHDHGDPEVIEIDDATRWENLQAHLDQAASDIHDAVTKGVSAAEPVFRERVAPALSEATAKLAEYADTARKATSERAGIADDTENTPMHQIGGGLAAVATGLLGLSKSLAEWLSEHAASAADKVKVDDDVTFDDVKVEPIKVEEVKLDDYTAPRVTDSDIDVVKAPVDDDVAAVADLLKQPVIVEDGETKVVAPD